MSKTYFSIYADIFALMKSQLSAAEIVEMLQALSELCMWEETDYIPQTKKQSYFWERLKSKFDNDEELYNMRSRAGKEGAKKRWDSKTDSKTDSQITNNKNIYTLSSDKSSESVLSREKKSKKFNPPTYEEVLNYATERGRADLAKQFFDYFTVGNWKDSSGKAVISWKQKFVTWENHTPVKDPPKPPEMSAEEKRRQQELIDKIFGE